MPDSNDKFVVYGCGGIGRQVIDELLENEVAVDLIIDRGYKDTHYRGVPVMRLGDASDQLRGKTVLVALHNHYVDLAALRVDLIEAGADRVLSTINLPEIIDAPRTRPGYWLEFDYSYAAHAGDFERLRSLLADEKSKELLDSVLEYRATGDIAHCPSPTPDEYTPADLPRYRGPLQLIDCGAYTGVAIQKLMKAGYAFESIIAFEPDLPNFAILAGRTFPAHRLLRLPLATWSSTTSLRFGSESSATTYRSEDGTITVQASGASHLSEDGDVVVQCVAIDDVLKGEPVNLVKLDVEGAELETLRGMECLVRQYRPNLLVSAYHTPGHLHELADLIVSWDLDYKLFLRVHEFNTFGVVLYCLQDDLLE